MARKYFDSKKRYFGYNAGKTAVLTANVEEYGIADTLQKTVINFINTPLTLIKNATTSAGAGLKIYTFAEGMILPFGATSNLTLTGASASYLMSLGTVAADTGGTLTGTEANFAPQTAATIASGIGTAKMKSTVAAPVPGTPFDGTSTLIDLYLNAALNADGTGKETIYVSGTVTIAWMNLGDS